MDLIQRHLILLKDTVRMEAYKRAIGANVRPGDTVIDIGCGLGILSFLAIDAGADHVHAIEVEPSTLEYARLIAKRSGLDKKITFHRGLSTEAKIKDKADVIISEIFGSLGFNENLLPVIIDARTRLLKKGGKIIPEGIKVMAAPVEYAEWNNSVNLMHNVYGHDLLPDAEEIDLGTRTINISERNLLAPPATIADIDLAKTQTRVVKSTCYFKTRRDGLLSGFAGWFETRLTNGITFSTSPNEAPTHWGQGFLPLRRPQPVLAEQHITFKMLIEPGKPAGLTSIVSYNYELK